MFCCSQANDQHLHTDEASLRIRSRVDAIVGGSTYTHTHTPPTTWLRIQSRIVSSCTQQHRQCSSITNVPMLEKYLGTLFVKNQCVKVATCDPYSGIPKGRKVDHGE